MNRVLTWADEQLTDLGVMIAAFFRGFSEGMRK
jgi:hypothetical protein